METAGVDAGEATARPPVVWPGLDGVAGRRFDLLVIGDVRLEVRAELRGMRFTDLTADRLAYADASAVVAGTAVNMARSATAYFRNVGLFTRIGDDDHTGSIRRELSRIGVRDLCRVDSGMPNGVAVMVRDDAPAGPGVRLLIAARNAPSRRLSEADVRRAAAEIRAADVVFLDGYALLSPISRAAMCAAARIANESGTLVAFDLVPHDIDGRVPRCEVLPLLALTDVVVTEAATVARLLEAPPPVTSAEARELPPLLDRSVGGRPLWLLRFGETNLENVLAYRRGEGGGGLQLEYASGYGEGVERAGFGDRLASCELYWWLSARSLG
ncbi:carbohydrate kinase family protein [Actinomadura rudentiformis]|uniref:Carbohydrate kinase family protein n=1 Tax=Actinomadura rudentiformis TaxID=359158 RepID=A0A6H9Y8C5_9ACTN|nr:carbohydrate kinase family protein [Actinomadura rudentiformis]KAB2341101.1 carbohydrate kinase family protein [Actinomadura rudentiformis]